LSSAPLAILCGAGDLPLEIARAARLDGREPFLIPVFGVATADFSAFAHEAWRLGAIGALFATLRARGIGEIALIGAMNRPDWRELRLDWGAIKRADDIAKLFSGGDDALLVGVIAMIEREGVSVVGALDVAPNLAAPSGAAGRVKPDAEDEAAAKIGFAFLEAISPFDVGQSCVVLGGRVVAVEGVEGTDAMLGRVADMRGSGRLRAKGDAGVFVKAPKRGQDTRVDLPTIGPKTVAAAKAAGLRGLALAAGQVLIADRSLTLAAADAAGLFVFGAR